MTAVGLITVWSNLMPSFFQFNFFPCVFCYNLQNPSPYLKKNAEILLLLPGLDMLSKIKCTKLFSFRRCNASLSWGDVRWTMCQFHGEFFLLRQFSVVRPSSVTDNLRGWNHTKWMLLNNKRILLCSLLHPSPFTSPKQNLFTLNFCLFFIMKWIIQ